MNVIRIALLFSLSITACRPQATGGGPAEILVPNASPVVAALRDLDYKQGCPSNEGRIAFSDFSDHLVVVTSGQYCTSCYHMAYHLRSLMRRSASRSTQVVVAFPESDSAYVCSYLRSSRSGVPAIALSDSLANESGLDKHPYIVRIRHGQLAGATAIRLNQMELADSVLNW